MTWTQNGTAAIETLALTNLTWAQNAYVEVTASFTHSGLTWQANADSTFPFGDDLLVDGYVHYITGTQTWDTVTVTNGGKIACRTAANGTTTNGIWLTANAIYVSSNSSIDVSGTSYKTNSTQYGPGGSHGGRGGYSSYAGRDSGPTYGSLTEPADPGEAGPNGSTTYATRGGGVVKLQADRLVLDGALRADGALSTANTGGGAGGSIWLEVGELSGTGSITAHGGAATNTTGYAGGGGGRIAIYYGDAGGFDLARVKAYGGNGNSRNETASRGGAGTVYLKAQGEALGQIVVDNTPRGTGAAATELRAPIADPLRIVNARVTMLGDIEFGQPVTATNFALSHAGAMTFAVPVEWSNGTWTQGGSLAVPSLSLNAVTWYQNGTATVSEAFSQSGLTWYQRTVADMPFDDLVVSNMTFVTRLTQTWDTVTVTNGGRITTEAPGLWQTNAIAISARQIWISADSSVDASSKGWTGTNTTGGAGGSHGGLGGVYSSSYPPAVYGNDLAPVTPGMGGATSNVNRRGGGVIHLVADELVLNGVLNANGAGSTDYYQGSGAGGSIWMETGVLSGLGSIRANGGSSGAPGGGGGGGRIAVSYNDASGFNLGHVTVTGGSGAGGGGAGGAGTVHLENRQSGVAVSWVEPRTWLNAPLTSLVVRFTVTIDPATFSTDDVVLTGPEGTVAIAGVESLDGLTYRVDLAAATDAEGTYQYLIGPNVQTTNELGMAASQYGEFILDLTAPATPEVTSHVLAPAGTNELAATSTTIGGTREAGSAVWINGTRRAAAGSGAWSWSTTLGQGTNRFRICAQDAAGNWSATNEVVVVADTVAPAAGAASPVNNAYLAASPEAVTLAFVEATSGLDVEATGKSVKRGGVTAMPGDWSVAGNRLVFVPQGAMLDGTYVAEVQLRDRLGNAAAVQQWRFTVDTTAPAAPEVDAVATPTSISQQTITGRREAFGMVMCNGTTASVSASSTIWSWTAPLTLGANGFSFTVRDRAGNESPATNVTIQYDNEGPGTVTVAAAVLGTGTRITLDWSSFDELENGGDIASYAVYQADAAFTAASAGTLLGTVPAGTKSFVVGNLERNVTKHYGVVAVDAAGLASPAVNSIAAAPVDVVAPADPTNAWFECGWSNLTVNWAASANEDGDLAGYQVGFAGQEATSLGADVTQCAQSGLAAATSYAVRVQAQDASGNVGAGLVVTGYTLVRNPTAVTATPFSGSVDLAWTAATPTQNVAEYRVFAAETAFTNVAGMTAAASATGLTASVAGLANGKTYHFGVAAVNRSGGMDSEVASTAATPRPDAEGPVAVAYTYDGVAVSNGMVVQHPGSFRVQAADRAGVGGAQLAWNGVVRTMAVSNGTNFSLFWNIADETNGIYDVTLTLMDTLGNAAESTNRLWVLLAAPTNAPVITSPAHQSWANQADILVEGTADSYAQTVRVYRGSTWLGEAPILGGTFSVPVTLAEGTNQLKAAAVNRGGEGTRSAARIVVLDSNIPSAPSGMAAESQEGGVIRLSWWEPLSADVAGYRVYRSTGHFSSTAMAVRVNGALLTEPTLDDLPVVDGSYHYRVSAVNSAGTEGALSAEVNAVSDRTAPKVLSIGYETTGPTLAGCFGTGTVSVALTVSEKLQALPFLSLARSNGLPIAVPLAATTETSYEGAFALKPGMGAGILHAVFSGRDGVGNRGTEIALGDTLSIDTEGPAARRLTVEPVSPILNASAHPTTVTVRIEFDGNDRPVETPSLTWRLSASQANPTPVALSPATWTIWSGEIALPATAGQTNEWLEFAYEGVDALGNRSAAIQQAARTMVYQGALPPADSPLGLAATAGPGGTVTLSWHAVDDATAYAVYRQAPGEPALTVHAASPTQTWGETTAVEGEHWYAVASVRTANGTSATSAVSEAVAVTADATAPDAPTDVRLMLYGQGLAATWTPPESGANLYRLYRGTATFSSVATRTPLIDRIASTNAVDSVPVTGPAFYAVTALDGASNESAPSAVAYTNLSLLPVSSLRVKRVEGQAPVVSWTHSSVAGLAGYNLYVGPTGLTFRVNDGLISRLIQNWVDEGYTDGNRWYGVSAEDGVREGVVRSLMAPGLAVRLATTNRLIRGWMNRLDYEVANESGTDLANLSLTVAVGGKTHRSEGFDLEAGATRTVPVVVGGYTNLGSLVVATNELAHAPNAGEGLTQAQEDLIKTGAGTLVLTVQPESFVRGGEGAVRFTLHNISDVDIEVVTAKGGGSAPSPDVSCMIMDGEKMVYATATYKQMTGDGVVTLSDGTTVARIPAHASFQSGPIPVQLPSALPIQVVAQVQVGRIFYRHGDPAEVSLGGPTGRTTVDLRETAYYATLTNVSPRASTGNTNVLIQGMARRRTDDAPEAEVPVKLILSQAGFDRTYELMTDANGEWSYDYVPSTGDAGTFTVVAMHPTVTERSGEQTFSIQRVAVSPTYFTLNCPRGFGAPISVKVTTGPGTTLTNLSLEYLAIDQAGGQYPTGIVVTNRSTIAKLGARATGTLTATFQADATASASGQLVLRVKSGEETWGAMTVSYALNGTVAPVLSWTPASIETGVAVSNRQVEKVTIQNVGYASLSNAVATLSAAESTNESWGVLATPGHLPALPPGETWELEMSFQPGPGVALTTTEPYRYTLRVAADNHAPIEVPVLVFVDASGKGNALIRVTDLYTGTIGTNGQAVAGVADARVRLVKQEGLLYETNLTTDASGEVFATGLPAGLYNVRVSAANHTANSVNLWVRPGATATESVHLSMSLITVEWSVTPTTIQDVYTIALNATYQTKVPAAVVSVTPQVLPLPDDMAAGDVFNGEITLQNLGLIQAEQVVLALPESDEYFHYELLKEAPETLRPSQVVRLPYRVVCVRPFGEDEAAGGGGCYAYSTCGEVKYLWKCINGVVERGVITAGCVNKRICSKGTPVSWISGTGGSGSGGWGGGGGGGGYGSTGGATVSAQANSDQPCNPEKEDKPDPEENCQMLTTAWNTGSHVDLMMRGYHDYEQDLVIEYPGGTIKAKRFYDDVKGWTFRIGPHEDIYFHKDWVVLDLDDYDFTGWYVDAGGVVRMTGQEDLEIEVDPLKHPEALTYRNRIVKYMMQPKTALKGSSSSSSSSGTATVDYRSEFMVPEFQWSDRLGNWAHFDGATLKRYGDRNGVITHVLHDPLGRITGYLDHFSNQVAWLSYAKLYTNGMSEVVDVNLLTSVRDAAGREIRYQYDQKGLLTNVVGLASNQTRYAYGTASNELNRLVAKWLPDGKAITVHRDGRGSVAAVSNNQGGSLRFQYNYDSARDRYYALVRDEAGRVVETWHDKYGTLLGRSVNGVLTTVDTNEDPNATFDARHNLVKYVSPEGTNAWTYSGRWPWPVAAQSWNGASYANEYDERFNLLREVSRTGTNVTEDMRYTYDEWGNRLSATLKGLADRPDLTWRWTYDEKFRPVTQTDPWGQLQTNTYDAAGQLVAARLAEGMEWRYTYDAAGRLLTVRDPQGGMTSNRYDQAGRRVWTRDPRGIEDWITYATNGLLMAMSNSLGKVARYERDVLGRVVREVHPDGTTTEYQYDAKGARSVVGTTPTVEMDAQGLSVRVTTPDGQQYAFGFDDETGRLTSFDTPRIQVRYHVDGTEHRQELTPVAGGPTLTNRWIFNETGELVELVDAANRKRTFAYNGFGNVSTFVNALGFTNRFEYGTPVTMDTWEDARGFTHRLTTDYTNRTVGVVYPDGTVKTRRHGPFWRRAEEIYPGGRTVRTVFDVMGRVAALEYRSSPQVAQAEKTAWFTYDAIGRLTGYGFSNEACRTEIAYDDAARRATETTHFGGFSATQTQVFDAIGRKVSYTDPRGVAHTFAYDSQNRFLSMTIPNAGVIRFEEDPAGGLEITLPGGTVQRFVENAFSQVRSNLVRDPAGQSLLTATYDYNAAGQVTNEVVDGESRSYDYDAEGQLTAVSGAGETQTFGYDGNGNRVSAGADGAWTYDAVNRLQSRPGATYACNAEGAVTQRVANGCVWAFEYDVAGKLAEIRSNGQWVARYAYDPLGRRVSKATAGATNHYLYADEGLAAEFDAAGQIQRNYVYKPDQLWMSAPLYVQEGAERYFTLRDSHGMVAKLVTADGAVAWSARAEAFGRAEAGAAAATTNRLRFSGQYEDAESGLHYNTFRYYDPEIGRYLTPDPLGFVDGINRYQFSHNDPVNRADPWGLYGPDFHFYITFIRAINAGYSPKDAFQLAVGAQYPDQDMRTDAVETSFRSYKPWETDYFSTQEWRDKMEAVLHQLHGRDRKYTECNRCVLAQLIPQEKDLFLKGMLVHAWGDTFGHLDIERLPNFRGRFRYKFGIARYNFRTTAGAYKPGLGHAEDGSAPDLIALRPDLAKDAANGLYQILGGDDPSGNDDVDSLINHIAGGGIKDIDKPFNTYPNTSKFAEEAAKKLAESKGLKNVPGYSDYDPHRMYDPNDEKKKKEFKTRTLSDQELIDFVDKLSRIIQKECR